MEALVGTVIGGKYRLEKRLGQGGMGMVFAATQLGLNRRCAVKLLHEALSQDHQLVARFKREAEVAASIGHPNIIQVTDFGYEDGKVFLVMDLLQGMPLAQAIEQSAPMPADRVRFIATQVLSALDAAHQREIVHRDLKPDNIYLTSMSGVADVVKLLDFGIARMTSEQSQKMTTTGQVLGTPAYMSPEQARGKEVDLRTDLYSLGVVMYEALSGRMPVDGANYHELMFNIVGETPVPLEELRPDLPKALVDIVAKAMAKNVDDRYSSAIQMKRELDALGPIDATSPMAIQVASTPPARADDAFAKTITPEAVLPVDTQRPMPRAHSDPDSASGSASSPGSQADSGSGISGNLIWIAPLVITMALVAGGVYALTRPDSEPELTSAPQVDERSEEERARKLNRELTKRMLEKLHRFDMQQDMQPDQLEPADEDMSEPTIMETEMRVSMQSSHTAGRPSHARYTVIEPPPPGDWRRGQCCPDAWHDFSGVPIVWATCGGSARELYPVLATTRLTPSSWQGNRVVDAQAFRTWTQGHATEITNCYRGHAAVNGQQIQLDIDAEGHITGVRFGGTCPVPAAVRTCVTNLLSNQSLPPDERAPGAVSFGMGVVGT